MSLRRYWRVVALCLISTGCGDSNSPGSAWQIEVLAGAHLQDSVVGPIVPLVVRLKSADSTVAGRAVAFVAVPPDPADSFAIHRSAYVCPNGSQTCAVFTPSGYFVQWGTVDTADAAGEVRVQMQTGTIVGTGAISIMLVTGEQLGSVTVTTTAGALARVAAVRDTAVYIGASYALAARATDRFGNARTEPVTVTTMTPAVVTAAGGTATAVGLGRGPCCSRPGPSPIRPASVCRPADGWPRSAGHRISRLSIV